MSVKLRKKNLSGGRKSLYLDIYHKGKRNYDFLDLVLEDEVKVKKESKNEMILLSKRIKEANSRTPFQKNKSIAWLIILTLILE